MLVGYMAFTEQQKISIGIEEQFKLCILAGELERV